MSNCVFVVIEGMVPISVIWVIFTIPLSYPHKTFVGCVVGHEVLSKRWWLVLLGIVPDVRFDSLFYVSLVGSSTFNSCSLNSTSP